MTTLAATFFTIQQNLFPALEAELKQPLSKPLELFVSVAELANPARCPARAGNGLLDVR